MNEKDIIITPLFLLLIYLIAYYIRPLLTNKISRKYFIPALTVKIIGAIGLGCIYTFYYRSGDTFNYYDQGSIIYNALAESLPIGINLIMGKEDYSLYEYTSQINWYGASQNMFVVKTCAILGMTNFNTYLCTAIIFAFMSFLGLVALAQVFYDIFSKFIMEISIAIFFIPSVFFWGSGILKDTIVIGSMGWAVWAFYSIFIKYQPTITKVSILVVSIAVISVVKTYVLFCLLPSIALWVTLANLYKIKSRIVRVALLPFFLILTTSILYISIEYITSESQRYSLDNLVDSAARQQQYLADITDRKALVSGRDGSKYEIPEFDGSIQSAIKVIPSALIVSLFRPFIYEFKNPVQLLSALETTVLLLLSIYALFNTGIKKIYTLIIKYPSLSFCITFSIIFAIGVGITSGNFGSLVRYRIPLLPFFTIFLLILINYKKLETKSPKL